MKRFSNILYVAEPSVEQDAAIARATSLARNNLARLTVVDVIPEPGAGDSMLPGALRQADVQRALADERRQALESLLAPHAQGLTPAIEVLTGRRFLEVIGSVLRNGHDLVIKPAEDPDWLQRLFGSGDMHLLRKCPCPVWLLKPQEKSNYECIVAAVDFSLERPDPEGEALNQEIIELAGSLALSDFAALHLAHAWEAPEAGFVGIWAENSRRAEMEFTEGVRASHAAAMDGLANRLRGHIGAEAYQYLKPRIHLPMGPPRKVIPALAGQLQADLVVMGTVARSGIPGLIIGNTAESVLEQLRCSVLAIKPPGFVSPVSERR